MNHRCRISKDLSPGFVYLTHRQFQRFQRGLVWLLAAMAGKDRRRDSSARGREEGPPEEEGGGENLWSSLLGEVQTSRTSQLPTSKALLVLGDKESGKTTLIAKLQVSGCLYVLWQYSGWTRNGPSMPRVNHPVAG